MGRIIEFNGIPDDLDTAVAARLERQRILRRGDHRFAVVLEEWALRLWDGTTGTSRSRTRMLAPRAPPRPGRQPVRIPGDHPAAVEGPTGQPGRHGQGNDKGPSGELCG